MQLQFPKQVVKFILKKGIIKNVSSSNYHKKLRPYVCLSGNNSGHIQHRHSWVVHPAMQLRDTRWLVVWTIDILHYLREFQKIIPNLSNFYKTLYECLYYEYMQIFHFFKYDLKGHWSSQKVTLIQICFFIRYLLFV